MYALPLYHGKVLKNRPPLYNVKIYNSIDIMLKPSNLAFDGLLLYIGINLLQNI